MNNSELLITTANIARIAKSLGITQEDISKATSISQSQVSRILSGQGKRKTKAFLEVCNYVNSKRTGITPELVRQNEEMIQAITEVWDGSAHQSKAIANIIKSLGSLCTISSQKSNK